MYILSIFITSNSVHLLVYKDGVGKNYSFPFYPNFQDEKELEYLMINFLKTIKVSPESCLFLITSTTESYTLFGKPSFTLNELQLKDKDFFYVYFDNLTLIGNENISSASLGLTTRSDNFVSNRSIFPSKVFNNDLEEIVFFSKSINQLFKTKKRKIVLGGDYFSNEDVPNEYKINFVSEILGPGVYEIYLDTNFMYPHYANLNIQTNVGFKSPGYSKFVYLFNSEKDMEFLLNRSSDAKFFEIKRNEVLFLHTDIDSKKDKEENLNIKFKGKEFGKGDLNIDREFGGIFFDRRNSFTKKENLGIESLRQVINSIEKSHDYSNF